MAWRIGKGDKVIIGLGLWIGCKDTHKLLDYLILELKRKGYQTVIQISQGPRDTGKQLWLTWREIGLREEYAVTWDIYTQNLR